MGSYLIQKTVKIIVLAIGLILGCAQVLFAESENRLGISFYGSFLYTDTVPNALFFFSDIEKNDSFELRKALRNHDIDTLVLSSRGGSVWEGLSMAGIIHDKGLTTYVPKLGLEGRGDCASACSFMFFAGKTREAAGDVGVHQFYSGSGSKSAEVGETEEIAQFTVSEIIGFLNEFDTPPFVFERMFQQSKMYYFDQSEMKQIARAVTPLGQEQRSEIESFINEFLIELAALEAEEGSQAEQKKELKKNPSPQKQPSKEKADTVTQKQIVKNIQTELNRLNCNAGLADGVIGNKTKSALARYATAAGKFIDEGMLNKQTFLTELQTSQFKCNLTTGANLVGNLICAGSISGFGPEKITIYNISNPPGEKSYKVEVCRKNNSCKTKNYPHYNQTQLYMTIGDGRIYLNWNYGNKDDKVILKYQIMGKRFPSDFYSSIIRSELYSKCVFSPYTENNSNQNTSASSKTLAKSYKFETCAIVSNKRECSKGNLKVRRIQNNKYEFEESTVNSDASYGVLKTNGNLVELQMVDFIEGVTVAINGTGKWANNSNDIIFSFSDEHVLQTFKKAGIDLKIGEITDLKIRWF